MGHRDSGQVPLERALAAAHRPKAEWWRAELDDHSVLDEPDRIGQDTVCSRG